MNSSTTVSPALSLPSAIRRMDIGEAHGLGGAVLDRPAILLVSFSAPERSAIACQIFISRAPARDRKSLRCPRQRRLRN